MSEIDKLLISVGIDEGSKLDELYNMLKELQKTGEIKVDFPEMPTKRQIAAIQSRITQLSNIIKPMIEKFPEMEDSIKKMFDDIVVIRLNEILEIVKKSLKEGFGEDIKSLIKDIEKQVSREEILRILETVTKIRGQLQTLQARMAQQIRREFDKFDIESKFADIENNIREILDTSSIIFLLDEKISDVSSMLNKIKAVVDLTPTQGDLEILKKWFQDMRVSVESDFQMFLRDYFDWTDQWERVRVRLDKIIMDRSLIHELIRERFERSFMKWKGLIDVNITNLLNDNIPRLIEPELNTFLDAIAAIFSKREKVPPKGSLWAAPGVKASTEGASFEGQSGFFRDLVAWMATASPKGMEMTVEPMTQRTFHRRIEEMKGIPLTEALRFLGLEPIKEERTVDTMTRIVEQIKKTGLDVKDIVTGTDEKVDKIKTTMETKNIEEENFKKDAMTK